MMTSRRAATPLDRRLVLAALTLLLLPSCALLEPAPPPPPVEHAQPSPPPASAALAPSKPPAPPTPLVEERDIGEATGLTPPTEDLAAVPPAAPEAAAGAPTETESLLSHIGPTTPPNVAAALRLVEEGRQYLNQQRYDVALDRFERSVAIDPTSAYGYYFLAQLHYRMKKYDQAIAFAGRAVTLAARTDRVWLARCYSLEGAVFEDAGRFADARKAYQNAMQADPNNLAAQVGVARLTGN